MEQAVSFKPLWKRHRAANILLTSYPIQKFLREGSAIQDTMNMERAVIGSTSTHASTIIKRLHDPFQTEVVETNLESAEMIKYAGNAMLATKISFINDIANICEKGRLMLNEVKELD
ncbi:hypothetical protein BSAF29S_04024 [Bacillus safensis subsp. safensis]